MSGEPKAVRVWLLGEFKVSVESRLIEEDDWRLRKAAALLKLLALSPQYRLHREQVINLLWPDLDERAAVNNLHHALHIARRTLGPASDTSSCYLRLRNGQLELCPEEPLWVDVEAFEEAAATARRVREPAAYLAALDLYGGDLLPGDRYEEWAEDRWEELRRTYLSLLVELAGLYEERKEFGAAIEALRRAITEEPAHEEAHVGLMRLYALSGRRAEALKQYKRLEEILSRKFATEPEATSSQLHEEISASRFPPAESTSPASLPAKGAPSASWHNLPTARTSFVGREKEIEEVERLLSITRLLTLSGAGGSGKTRLALEVARELVGSYPDGAWMVELASLAEGALVPQAVAEVMEVPEQPNRPLTDVLVDALSSRKLLLVLDNCEHLIDAASRLVDTLLDSCPHLRVLATSREALGVTGEVVRPVPPLAVPGTRHPLTVEELERCESARLFTERALQRWSGFALTSENAWNVAEICRRLDGIPLAIELAAARAGVLSVEQIARRLDDCFRLLSAGSRTALPRHRTLRATIGWSHGLLSEDERRLFRRLSVFAGGFTLGAAEAVCSGENLEEDEVLGLLAHLVDKSLLVVRERGGEMRYQLLETVRQYGWEKLEESGEAEAARRAHANFFLTWAEEIGPKIEPKIKTADRRPWLERLEIEHDNLRVALRWAVDTGEAKRGLRPAGALFWFWHMRGYLSEGRGWFERALAQVPARTVARAKALYYSGYLAWIQGDYPVARSQLQESVEIWRKLEGRRGALAHALWLLGLVMLAQGEITAARSLAEESVEMFRTIGGDDFGLSMSLAILGIVVVNQGDCTLATSLLEESAAVARKMGDDWFLSLPIRYLGAAAFRQGDYDRAAVLLKESLVLLWESGEKWYISRSIECLAAVDAMRGDHVRAARLFGAGEAMREAIGASQVPFYLVDYDRGMAAAQTALGEEAFAAAWAGGKAMTREAAMEYAFSDEASSSTDPMPASPTRTAKHNLPVSRSSFVGRERELVEVKERLDEARLLTLTGAGGSGKTRLALRVAEELVGAYRDGVWLVELAPLSEGELVPQVVAGALKVREQQERPMIETLIQALREKEILPVLDNCEHLVDAAASLVDTLLGTCPRLKVLATSREALRVAGEANWPVPPLSLPETDSPPMAEGLAGYEATQLFVQRARYHAPAFEPTGQNARAVAEVCRRLDGIPLAVELAAARVTMLSVEQISERLRDSLKLLTGGDRTAQPRHRTLRGALDWSFDLLDREERKLFEKLSVFAGGFALEAAEAVGTKPGVGDGIERDEVLDLLDRLVDKSLVVTEVGGEGSPRYRLLEPVRQYAREKLEGAATGARMAPVLAARPGEAEAVKHRHAAFFLALAERAEPELRGSGQVLWFKKLSGEQDNLRAAMAWLLGRGALETAVRLGWALWLFWYSRGHLSEGRGWLEAALARDDVAMPASLRAKALFIAGTMADGQADRRSAEPLLEESLALFRELGDKRGAAYALGGAGLVAAGRKRHEQGATLLEESAELFLEVGDRWGAALTLSFSAVAWRNRGDHARAKGRAERGLALSREIGDRQGTSVALYILAGLVQTEGDYEQATRLFEEGLELSAEVGNETNVAYCLEGLAGVAGTQGRVARAARLWGAAEALLEAIEVTAYIYASDRSLYQSRIPAARAQLGEAAFDEAWAEGKAMTPEEAVEYVLTEEDATPPTTSASEEPPDELTRREEGVAALVARGLTNRQIARELTLSKRTVDNHVANILKKLNLPSRSGVAARLEENGG